MSTRLVPPKHRPWIPLPYMARAAEFLASHYRAGLPLKPGGRKTSITLAAFELLRRRGHARTMLVVAPLRVARQVWKQEAEKWSDFQHFTFAHVTGDAKTRAKALKSGADIYLINYENLPWLAKQYMGRSLPFDVVTFDELTKMKNASAERHKAIRPRLAGVKYRWGLTGSLFAKGHMDIFGQQLILDDGAALGRYITRYRDTYFSVGYNGFDYDLIPGSEKRIVEKLAPYWFYMDDADYAQLPPLVDVPHIGTMEPQQRNLYDRMRKAALIQIGAHTITAANAGAVYSKLAQLANGAIYRDGHTASDEFEAVHELKLDMLEELLDELNGEPLLVAYEFQHDLLRIQERFGKRFGGKVPYLGDGTTAKQENEWVAAWNNRELPLLLAHPQSAGHGLNMQEGQAYNVAWFSVTWDWELYDQFIRRVRRSGNEQARIFNHLLIVRGTIDEEKLRSITEKDFTERSLMTALNNQIQAELAGSTQENSEMVAKLSRPSEAPPAASSGWGGAPTGQAASAPVPPATPPESASQPAPSGWGGGAQAGAPPAGGSAWGGAPDPTTEQRQRIQEQIAPQPDRAAAAVSAFSGGAVGAALDAVRNADYGVGEQPAQQPASGGAWAPPPQEQAPAQQPAAGSGWGGGTGANEPPFDGGKPAEEKPVEEKPARKPRATKAAAAPSDTDAALIQARGAVIAALISQSGDDDSVDDLIDIAREFMSFVAEG